MCYVYTVKGWYFTGMWLRWQMHLEAARMLSFTEEEFVKVLEWGKQ